MSSFNVPGVGTMTSTALTDTAVQTILQVLVAQMLGIAIDPADDEDPGYQLVRTDFPTGGQPSWKITEDIAFVGADEEPDSYNEQHEPTYSQDEDGNTIKTTVYTRVWRAFFDVWGPNSGDRTRQIKSCMFEGFAHATLAASNLYLLTRFATPKRSPDLFEGNWWERWSFSVRMNEQVTETLIIPTIESVEITTNTAAGQLSDIDLVLEE